MLEYERGQKDKWIEDTTLQQIAYVAVSRSISTREKIMAEGMRATVGALLKGIDRWNMYFKSYGVVHLWVITLFYLFTND